MKRNNHNEPTVYYRSKYSKHVRTDKIVQQILREYHNINIPKLTQAYCKTTTLHTTMLLTNKRLHSKLIHNVNTILIINKFKWCKDYILLSSNLQFIS